MTLNARQVRELLERHGLSASRALGQHFVADPNTVRRIAWLAEIGPGDRVVEIGAGLGSLTLALAETGAEVVAVEFDRYLLPVLHDVVASAGVRVVHGDAMTLDWSALLGDRRQSDAAADTPRPTEPPPKNAGHPTGPERSGEAEPPGGTARPSGATRTGGTGPWSLVANLPYNIATPLVLDLLAGVPAIGRMLVMVQREVGERWVAGVGDKAYGIPSVKVAYWAVAELVGRVPSTVLVPPPRVESVLVRVRRRPRPAVDVEPQRLFRLVEAGFGQRRKMLRRSLSGLVRPEDFARAGIRPEARAEELSLGEWGRLVDASAV